jgi:hypothetical protein
LLLLRSPGLREAIKTDATQQRENKANSADFSSPKLSSSRYAMSPNNCICSVKSTMTLGMK